LGIHTDVPKLANTPKRREAARMALPVTTATFATGNVMKADVQLAEL
jgi:hypothetical protein